ncbi:fumarylacetoacetate hydrolase [Pigmentiphaga sp. NML080357]|uniref:fumarylacetoacetate hydrolase family protein n=1 Tax=Pigmentiphaga sp. NML080357 TaxID=2008675 RepID=UPI000B417923|nr:fumarylacetoacetate hydrolase family protein [Pigmentiphaga sp. NML080357]OVZ64753.1 fumarylacetoacetate hydrolase [Pigmentiphaga sp. NML080357]
MFSLTTRSVCGTPAGCLQTAQGCYPIAASARVLGLDAMPDAVIDLFRDWPANLRRLARIATAENELRALDVPGDAPELAPLQYPGKVLCAGANYYDHLAEMKVPDAHDKSAQRLFFFFKPARQAIVGPGKTVHIPQDCQSFDWEVELALVIGREARAIAAANWRAHVAAYCVAIDFSARDLNRAPEAFYKFDWVAGKAHDTSCPLGRLVPACFVEDPHDLAMRLEVNGETRQDANTSGMIFDIGEQLATLSRIMTLEPGDVVLTGTPAGVGAARRSFLSAGDVVTARIGALGSLRVEIQPPRP